MEAKGGENFQKVTGTKRADRKEREDYRNSAFY